LLRITERGEQYAQVNRSLREEFATWLAGRDWELALLQEAPPRWRAELAPRSGASAALALTSRNSLAWLRGLLADLNPDLIASGEGGSNQLLARAPARITAVRRLTLTERPERRRLLWARVEAPGGVRLAVANVHATAGDPQAAARDVELAAERAVEWAGDDPLVFGGDLNLRKESEPEVFERLRECFALAAPTATRRALDHLLARGLEVVEPPEALAPEERELTLPDGLRLRLSDHAPVVASFGMRYSTGG
jgi:endonuclease/exonuclease/phosphatase family metal-dependent hydrolase